MASSLSSISNISLVLSFLQIHFVNWASTMVNVNAEYTENQVVTTHHTSTDWSLVSRLFHWDSIYCSLGGGTGFFLLTKFNHSNF